MPLREVGWGCGGFATAVEYQWRSKQTVHLHVITICVWAQGRSAYRAQGSSWLESSAARLYLIVQILVEVASHPDYQHNIVDEDWTHTYLLDCGAIYDSA